MPEVEEAIDIKEENGEETIVVPINTDENEKPAAKTIARTVVFFLAWLNLAFEQFGIATFDIDPDTLYAAISVVITAAASIWAWWKDNPFTKAAIKSNKVFQFLKKIGQ